MSLPSRLRVLVFGSNSPGAAGSGICFAQTTTFIRRAFSLRLAGDHHLSGVASPEQKGAMEHVGKEAEVRLSIPASPEFLRLARLAAAGLASRMGFTCDEVEDLRIAIDELCFSLVGKPGRPGTIVRR